MVLDHTGIPSALLLQTISYKLVEFLCLKIILKRYGVLRGNDLFNKQKQNLFNISILLISAEMPEWSNGLGLGPSVLSAYLGSNPSLRIFYLSR